MLQRVGTTGTRRTVCKAKIKRYEAQLAACRTEGDHNEEVMVLRILGPARLNFSKADCLRIIAADSRGLSSLRMNENSVEDAIGEPRHLGHLATSIPLSH